MGGALTSLSSAGADSTPPPKTASAPPLAPRSPAAAAPPPPPRAPRGPLRRRARRRSPSSGRLGPGAIEQLNGDRQIRTYPNLMAAVHEVNAAANRGDGRLGLRGGQLTAAGLKRAAETGRALRRLPLAPARRWRRSDAAGREARSRRRPGGRPAAEPKETARRATASGLPSDEFTAVADAHSASATAADPPRPRLSGGGRHRAARRGAERERASSAIVGHRRWRRSPGAAAAAPRSTALSTSACLHAAARALLSGVRRRAGEPQQGHGKADVHSAREHRSGTTLRARRGLGLAVRPRILEQAQPRGAVAYAAH